MQKGLDSLRLCRSCAALARFLLLFFSLSLFFFFSAVTAASAPTITIDAFINGPNHSGGVSTASMTALVKDASGAALIGQTVTWSVVSANNATNAAVTSAYATLRNGLAWGATHGGVTHSNSGKELMTQYSTITDSTGKATIQISDIVGERTVTLRASVTIGGTAYTLDQAVTFGKGPLKVFKTPGSPRDIMTWEEAYQACNGFPIPNNHSTGWTKGAYVGGPKMPTTAELRMVSSGSDGLKGAGFAAGWSNHYYWSGEASGYLSFTYRVLLSQGHLVDSGSGYPVACRR